METIKTILDSFFQRQKLDSGLKGFRVFDIWEESVGTQIARHSKPKGFRDHTLWVTVDNSIWMQQLTFLEGQLKEKLNQMMGSSLVEKIRFQIGEIHSSSPETSERASLPVWQEVEPEDAVKEDIEKEVAMLKDEELKTRLKRLFRKSVQFLNYKAKE
jgi:hypothetical protein